jgi:hypothetical protein
MERCTRFFTCRLYSFLSSSLLEKARDAASVLRCVKGSGDGSNASNPTSAWVVKRSEISVSSGGSARLRGCAAGPKRPRLCSRMRKAAESKRGGASSRGWQALPLPGRRV